MHGDWSPDGRSIVFDSERSGDREIYVMKGDGSGVRRIAESPDRDGYPRWSPDGTRIAFHSRRTGSFRIFVMSADGSGQRQLSSGGDAPRVASATRRGRASGSRCRSLTGQGEC